jgi:hypothetical protein
LSAAHQSSSIPPDITEDRTTLSVLVHSTGIVSTAIASPESLYSSGHNRGFDADNF